MSDSPIGSFFSDIRSITGDVAGIATDIAPNWTGGLAKDAQVSQTMSPTWNGGNLTLYVDAPTSGNNYNGHGTLAAAIKAGDYPHTDPEWVAIANQYKNGLQLVPASGGNNTMLLVLLVGGAALLLLK